VLRVAVLAALVGTSGVATAQVPPSPTPPPADAPPPPDQPPAPPTPAELAFREGRTLLEAGQFAQACAKFETSLKADPSAPGTLLNLGLCNERLGKTATALQWFRKAQFRSAETGMTDYEEAAKTETISLAVRVPTLRITFANPPPPGAVVFLDRQQLTEIDLSRVEVDPNVIHAIELRSDGKPPIRTDVKVKDGENRTVVIAVPAPPKPVITTVEIDRGRTRRIVAYSLGGAGVALWAASLIVSLDAKSSAGAAEHPEDVLHYRDVARWGGTSLFIGGAAAIGVAAFLYTTAPGIERVEKRTVVAPVVGSEQLGVAVRGSF
jgi:hypothetical protein